MGQLHCSGLAVLKLLPTSSPAKLPLKRTKKSKVVIPALVYYYHYSLTFIMILRGEPHTGAAGMNVKIKCNRTNPSDVSCGLTTSSSSCNNAPFLCRFKDSKLY